MTQEGTHGQKLPFGCRLNLDEMYKMLYVSVWFEPFVSEWGVISHQTSDGEVWLPLGWEDELSNHGIDFQVRELELPNLSETNNENE